MILVPTYSACAIRDGAAYIDRKFHTGICEYVDGLGHGVTVLAPEMSSTERLMDGVELSLATLPYRIEQVRCDRNHRVARADRERVHALVREACLIYGIGFGVSRIARRYGTPYVAVAEYNWQTQRTFSQAGVTGSLRRLVRAARAWLRASDNGRH